MPLKPAGRVKSLRSYVRCKQQQLQWEVIKKYHKSLSHAYGIQLSSGEEECRGCQAWEESLRQTFRRSTSIQERCRLLTLLPLSLSVKDVARIVSEASRYLIKKARKLMSDEGVWARPEQYNKRNVSEEYIQLALEYYTKDELRCSVKSPRPCDVVTIRDENGEKRPDAKRYVTRSIHKAYRVFREDNPDIKVGLSKFYSLRPRFVTVSPYREECVCRYCANCDLCVTAINDTSRRTFTWDELVAMCLCSRPTRKCFLGNCDSCPGEASLLTDSLQVMDDTEEVEICLWMAGELTRATLNMEDFTSVVQRWVGDYVPHSYLRNIQRAAIKAAKSSVHKRVTVWHFDFAENWPVVLPNETRGYHWKKRQISLFTCVITAKQSMQCYAVASDDKHHDTAFTLSALELIYQWLDDHGPMYAARLYVSDGVSAHLKTSSKLTKWARTRAFKSRYFRLPVMVRALAMESAV